MTIQEFGYRFCQFLNMAVEYYVLQLIRCAIISYAVFALVFLLRNTLCRNHVFLRSALWSLFLPILSAGRMKFFYENKAGVELFFWASGLCLNNGWVCWLYLCVAGVYGFLLLQRKRKLKKMLAHMEKRKVGSPLPSGKGKSGNMSIYVTDLPVTPSAIGIFRPKIIMPKTILEEYSKEEIHTILCHEKIHIRLGHLYFYVLWDILRVLLWVNPLFPITMKSFQEDLEEICDKVTIQKSGKSAYAYGQLLLKSMELLHAEHEDCSMYAAFAGDKEYQNIKKRMIRIAQYRQYSRLAAVGGFAAAMLCAAGAFWGVQNSSYEKNSELEQVLVYDENGTVLADDSLQQMISYDQRYVYVRRKGFEELLEKNHMGQDIYIVFGGFQKLPGIGGGASSCLYGRDGEEAIVQIPYEEHQHKFFIMLYKML